MTDFDCDIHQEYKDEIWQCLSCYDSGIARKERDRIIKMLRSDPEELIEAGGGLRAGYETAIELIESLESE